MLIGGADETPETNTIFSYMNLARAFAELDAGAELYCLHKNAWWQTSRGPLLDSGAFVAGLEYAAGVEATVLGKPSPTYFLAALEAVDGDPERTWMIGDDIEADIRGAQLHGMRTALVRTGKFRPDAVERSGIMPDAILSSVAVAQTGSAARAGDSVPDALTTGFHAAFWVGTAIAALGVLASAVLIRKEELVTAPAVEADGHVEELALAA